MSESEQWLPIPGWEGHYDASDQGAVRSVARTIIRRDGEVKRLKGALLKPSARGRPGCQMYLSVSLSKNGAVQIRTIHELVLAAFIGPRPSDKHVARHLNGNHLDNSLSNLAWGTQTENMADKFVHGTDYQTNKTHCKWGHEFTPENTYVRWRGVKSGRVGQHRSCRRCNSTRPAAAQKRRLAAVMPR